MKKLKTFSVYLIGITVLVFIFFSTVYHTSKSLLTVSKYTLTYENLPESFDNYKIVQISDLHNQSFGRDNKNLIKLIDSQSPDLVLISGDSVTITHPDFNNILKLCSYLCEKYTVLYVIGNHEQVLSDETLKNFYSDLSNTGTVVLDNQKYEAVKNGQHINIYGLWYHLRFYREHESIAESMKIKCYLTSDIINEILGIADKTEFNIILTHNPAYFESYCNWGSNLTFAGHAHGGLIRIPLVGGIFSPERERLFPPYDAGLFTKENKNMLISRGLGNGDTGFRFFNTPELVSVTLRCGS